MDAEQARTILLAAGKPAELVTRYISEAEGLTLVEPDYWASTRDDEMLILDFELWEQSHAATS